MSFINKPRVEYAGTVRNGLGLTLRDYEGSMSTLCAGCGHDSVSAALVQTFFELDVSQEQVAKMSGIGCSSKTPAYFMRGSHGINTVHGRMPAVATGAAAANCKLLNIGVSGDGDTLSIGLGQFVHAIRRNLNMLYVIENNGVYGLTKGQFSASSDVGSAAKKGEVNQQPPIDPALMAITLGASFVARGFSGDKDQLVPLMKAAMKHRGFALIDVLSPCVTFNDHETSTKSYANVRKNEIEMIVADFVPHAEAITAESKAGQITPVTLHDGSRVLLHRAATDFDPTDRGNAFSHLVGCQSRGEIPTGLLYLDEGRPDMHQLAQTVDEPLFDQAFSTLCPGGDALDKLQSRWR
ncbi:MAG: 2-oxoglutarate ferredoxin oxidoreductase subunit beta [Gammaproteobacteria bacterium]|jgi:2-oxoglutarate ferredoxin oxidoreductase subunit beta